MQSSENKPPPEDKNSGGQKGATQDHQPPHKCPRCDSSNTKFCYYNNYSLSQPRHFCKTCRRYWTRGGSLRNIPVGGGCRKTKKLKSAAAAATHLFSGGHPGDLGFQLHPGTADVYTQTRFISGSGPGFGLDLFGLNYPDPGTTLVGQGSGDHKISISSIESLSSINQEMHWKLQQQRLALVYDHHDHDHDDGNQKEKGELHGSINLFRNLEFSISNNNNNIPTNICGDNGTKLEVGPRDWSFEPTNYAPNVTTTTANSDINREVEEDGAANVAVAWSDLHQFNGLQ